MNQSIDIYVASLIVAAPPIAPGGQVIKKDRFSVLLKHAPYSYSIYSAGGGWVLLSPSPNAVKDTVSKCVTAERIFAAATMERQWVVKQERLLETAITFAKIITPQMPGYHSLSKDRKAEVEKDIERLCAVYMEREKNFTDFSIDAIPMDRRPFIFESGNPTDINTLDYRGISKVDEDEKIRRELLDLLTYYWESAFIIWWKGFW